MENGIIGIIHSFSYKAKKEMMGELSSEMITPSLSPKTLTFSRKSFTNQMASFQVDNAGTCISDLNFAKYRTTCIFGQRWYRDLNISSRVLRGEAST